MYGLLIFPLFTLVIFLEALLIVIFGEAFFRISTFSPMTGDAPNLEMLIGLDTALPSAIDDSFKFAIESSGSALYFADLIFRWKLSFSSLVLLFLFSDPKKPLH